MAQRVTMDAMIPREDFAYQGDEFILDLSRDFPISNLAKESPLLRLLRKPDFQRETNHWTPEQTAIFIESFLDNEVIPSLILWKSPTFIFVIDGGHRLSALRAWMEDDYGDRTISREFYNGEISAHQKRIAIRTRALIESRIGRYSTLRDLVGSKTGSPVQTRRANLLFTRALVVQWIQGSAATAETSFFKINSQGTPLDETEEMLIVNRRKPGAISARAILRAGAGNKYWSSFAQAEIDKIEKLAANFYELLFQPEANSPIKTLDLPLGGSVSPVDALALLVEFLMISGTRDLKPKSISEYADDTTGKDTISILHNSLEVVNIITGNSPGSLGLHPAVYFYNEKGKYSRFLFLGMTTLLTEKIRNNDDGFFKKFTAARALLEEFLIANKSLIGILLQNMSKVQRVSKVRDLFSFLIERFSNEETVTVEEAIAHLGLRGRIIDVVASQSSVRFTDDTKSMIYVKTALTNALKCPLCQGKLDPNKSVSYDHIVPVREGGVGAIENGQMVHPYCNTAVKG